MILIVAFMILFTSTEVLQNLKLRFVDSFFSIGSYYYSIYYTKPIFSTNSPYQHIMIMESPYYGKGLYLDGILQISDKASFKYHEYLIMPAIAASSEQKNILLIGGGDGGALYQILKYLCLDE